MATNTVQAAPGQAKDTFWPDFQKLPFSGVYRRHTAFWKVPKGTEDDHAFAEDAAFDYLKFIRSKGETRDTLSRIAHAMIANENYTSLTFFRIIESLLQHAVMEINVEDWEKRFKAARQRDREEWAKHLAAHKLEFAKERSERARHAAMVRHGKAKKKAA